jgi:hypothetical protein
VTMKQGHREQSRAEENEIYRDARHELMRRRGHRLQDET